MGRPPLSPGKPCLPGSRRPTRSRGGGAARLGGPLSRPGCAGKRGGEGVRRRWIGACEKVTPGTSRLGRASTDREPGGRQQTRPVPSRQPRAINLSWPARACQRHPKAFERPGVSDHRRARRARWSRQRHAGMHGRRWVAARRVGRAARERVPRARFYGRRLRRRPGQPRTASPPPQTGAPPASAGRRRRTFHGRPWRRRR